MIGRVALLLSVLLALPRCSADSVTPREPTVEQPGSFVAATDTDGIIFLVRTLRLVPLGDQETLYEAIVYQGSPSSYDEAEAWAKDPAWPVARPHAIFSLGAILSFDPEVVWFRSLTESERDALLR
jgi:hypothetical protein